MIKYYPFEFWKFFGELEILPYQIAFGMSIRFFESSWMFRFYLGCFKLWFNLGDEIK